MHRFEGSKGNSNRFDIQPSLTFQKNDRILTSASAAHCGSWRGRDDRRLGIARSAPGSVGSSTPTITGSYPNCTSIFSMMNFSNDIDIIT